MRKIQPFRKRPIEDLDAHFNELRANENRRIRKACLKMLEEDRENRKKGTILV